MKATFVTACGARQEREVQDFRPTYYLPLIQRLQVNWGADEPLPTRAVGERRFKLTSVHRTGWPDYALRGLYQEEI